MAVEDSVILITGGSGSLGEALIQKLLECKPHSLRILSNNEDEIFRTKEKYTDGRLRYFIGDIRDKNRLLMAFRGVDYVIHCAALKHVPLCEYNPIEVVKTNVMGSVNVVECAVENAVKKVIGISSDKAVLPINIYGASKLMMEKLFINAGVYGVTRFACIRFGNFKASRGSFLEKIKSESPIKITDVNMERYWISLEEAAQFTVARLLDMEGGEIFIPKMEKCNIMEFVGDRDYVVTGKRIGEKLDELLFTENEKPVKQGDYFVVRA